MTVRCLSWKYIFGRNSPLSPKTCPNDPHYPFSGLNSGVLTKIQLQHFYFFLEIFPGEIFGRSQFVGKSVQRRLKFKTIFLSGQKVGTDNDDTRLSGTQVASQLLYFKARELKKWKKANYIFRYCQTQTLSCSRFNKYVLPILRQSMFSVDLCSNLGSKRGPGVVTFRI